MGYFVDNLKNSFDFFLRNHITFSRKNYTEKPVNPEQVFESEEEKSLYGSLKEKYDLTPFYKLNEINFITNLYYLSLFDKHLTPPKKSLSILDIGSKNWNYSGSEYVFFKHFSSDLKLDGIELDAYRLCTNLFNRYEISKFYTKDLDGAKYHAGDFMAHNKKYDYIIWILPFITEYPHLKWGLPLKYFRPEEMLSHAYSLLNENGEMLIFNHGENEYNIQKELISKLGLNCELIGEVENEFNPYRNKRFCSIIVKH